MNSGLQVYNEQAKLAQWAQVVSQCRDSGVSVRQWCQENGVNVSSYYKWQRKVYAALKGFVTKNAANFVVGECKSWNKSIPCYGKIELNGSGAMCEVAIEINQFAQIMDQLHFPNPSLVIQQLKSHGLLNYEAKKNYRKRTIITDVGVVRVYVIKFP